MLLLNLGNSSSFPHHRANCCPSSRPLLEPPPLPPPAPALASLGKHSDSTLPPGRPWVQWLAWDTSLDGQLACFLKPWHETASESMGRWV